MYNSRKFTGVTLILAASLLLLPVQGCKREAAERGEIKFTVVTSFYPVYIIAKNVTDGIEGVRLVNMTPPFTGCLHDYSLTAGDMKNLDGAGILLLAGAGMESFMGTISERFPGLKTAELSKGIKLISGSKGENPHVWLSVANAIVMTQNCVEAMSCADPSNAGSYRENASEYTVKLTALKKEMDAGMRKFKGREIITFHEAFPYFAEEYGLKIVNVIEREPGSEPSAKELAATVDIVKKAGIKALFAEPQYPTSAADTIAGETGAKVYMLDPAVTGDDSCDAYIKIMRKNLSVMETALK